MPTLELLQRTQKLYPNNNNPTVAATAASAGGGTGRRKKQQRDNVSDAGTFDSKFFFLTQALECRFFYNSNSTSKY